MNEKIDAYIAWLNVNPWRPLAIVLMLCYFGVSVLLLYFNHEFNKLDKIYDDLDDRVFILEQKMKNNE